MRMKYIVYETNYDENIIVLFPERIDHGDFALNLGEITVVSAGFVRGDELNAPYCYGKSTSLGVESRQQIDTNLLLRNLGWND